MKNRPILFSAPMVRALLDGSKTQTRRIVKGSDQWPTSTDHATVLGSRGTVIAVDAKRCTYGPEIKCPYGQPGARLWVRETFTKIIGQTAGWIETDYRATYTHGDRLGDTLGLKKRWTPAIHMPRDASRITLEVTGMHVERLQDIDRGDAMAEGCPFPNMAHGEDPRKWYADLWDDINGQGSWDLNPWVWVIEFKRVTA